MDVVPTPSAACAAADAVPLAEPHAEEWDIAQLEDWFGESGL
jgi:hypothetical protein